MCFIAVGHRGKTQYFLLSKGPTRSPDWHHSAPSRLDVFDVRRRYVGLPKRFHGFIRDNLSQDT